MICTIRNPSRSLGRLGMGTDTSETRNWLRRKIPKAVAATGAMQRPVPAACRSFRRAGSNCELLRQTNSASDNPINHMVSTSEAHSSQVHHPTGKRTQHPLEFQQVTSHEQSAGDRRAQPDQTAAAGGIQQPADDRNCKAQAENKQAEPRKEVHTQKHCYHSTGCERRLASFRRADATLVL